MGRKLLPTGNGRVPDSRGIRLPDQLSAASCTMGHDTQKAEAIWVHSKLAAPSRSSRSTKGSFPLTAAISRRKKLYKTGVKIIRHKISVDIRTDA
jgi:hypothetical protein